MCPLVLQDRGERSRAGGGGGGRAAAVVDHQRQRAASSPGAQVTWEGWSPGELLPQHKLKLETEKKREKGVLVLHCRLIFMFRLCFFALSQDGNFSMHFGHGFLS